MNSQQLESFIEVAETLNFARAAEAMNLTQSAISRQIRSLEDELGTTLFKRTTRNVTLTTSGIIFLNDAIEILSRLKLSQAKIKNLMDEKIDIIKIGCMNNAYLTLITPILKKLNSLFPHLHPYVQMMPLRIIVDSFLKNEVDFVFGFKDDIPILSGVGFIPLSELSICVAVNKEHKLSLKETISEQEITDERIILCESHQLPIEVNYVQNKLARHIINKYTNYCHDINTQLCLIKAGYGFGILPKLNEEGIKFIPFENMDKLVFGLYYHEDHNVFFKDVMKCIKEEFKYKQ